VVAPEYVLFVFPNTHNPAPIFVIANVLGPAASANCKLIWLSPVELPCNVNVFAPVAPANATAPVFPNTNAALFAVVVPKMLFPYVPLESIVPFAANVNRRSIVTEGVCVVWYTVAFAP
jgi:hypothetical protein